MSARKIKKTESKKALLAMVRIRGRVRLKVVFTHTMQFLRLHRENHCVILYNTPEVLGMLKKVRDYVTYGEVSDEVVREVVSKRGRKIGNTRLSETEVTE